MTTWPLRFREIDDRQLFFSNDVGGFFVSDDAFLSRYTAGEMTAADSRFLAGHGSSFDHPADLSYTAFAYRWARRQNARNEIAYVMLVPTLRCNLACTYCQVSRAAETASGFDWTEALLSEVLRFLNDLETQEIKIEFQGGEPLLRTDILSSVRDFCRRRFKNAQFVVCTNLQLLGPEQLAFFDSSDTFASTSIDGALADHNRTRTHGFEKTRTFFANLETFIDRFGSSRLSALPTIDIHDPPDFDGLIDTYLAYGLRSIYLRPVNYLGFARRTPLRGDELVRWNPLHASFIDRLIERNYATGDIVEEFYFSHCLRRVLRPGHDGHVNLRNPSLFAADYLVIDYDGQLYPTDEARMLSRMGQIDLSMGSVQAGIDQARVAALNGAALNNFDPDCIHCAYQPYCGSDPIDAVSRYGRVDVPKGDTWFCGRQLAIFDRIVQLIYSRDPKDLFSLCHWAGVATWPAELAPVHS